jgi:hypothetical protein
MEFEIRGLSAMIVERCVPWRPTSPAEEWTRLPLAKFPIRPGVDLSRSVIVEVTLTTGRTFRAEPITIGDPPLR